jgi:hypothetical protein
VDDGVGHLQLVLDDHRALPPPESLPHRMGPTGEVKPADHSLAFRSTYCIVFNVLNE